MTRLAVCLGFSTFHTVTVSGSRLKDVRCQQCGNVYYYLLTRSASGSQEEEIFTSESAARKAAAEVAFAALGLALDREHDVVPCPTCRHVQAFLVAQERDRRSDPYIVWVGLAALGFFVAGAFGVVLLVEALGNPIRSEFGNFVLSVVSLLAALGCGIGFVYAGRKWRAGREYDPNGNPLDFPRGLTTNKPMTRQQYEAMLRRQATEAITVLMRLIPFGQPVDVAARTGALAVIQLAAKELGDADLAAWATVEPNFEEPPTVDHESPPFEPRTLSYSAGPPSFPPAPNSPR